MSSRYEARYRICPKCGKLVLEFWIAGHEDEDALECRWCQHRFERKGARGTTHPA